MEIVIKNNTLKKYTSITFLAFLLLLFSCKASKIGQKTVLKRSKPAKVLLKKLKENQVNAEWLAAKAKVTVRDGSGVRKFTSILRWKQDSLLWMNFKKVSVEAARTQITPDSIIVLDRIHKEYLAEDFSFAQQQFNLPTGFDGLQTLLLGNPIFFTEKFTTGIDNNQYHLKGKNDQYLTEYWLEGETYSLRQMHIDDYRSNRQMTISLGDYQDLPDGQKFSYFRRLDLSSKETGEISIKIELSKVEVNVPKTIRFDIPDHYKKIQ